MTVVTAGEVVRCAAAYLDEIITQSDLRHRVLSAARRRARSTDPAIIQALSLLSHALESQTPSSSPSPSSSTPSKHSSSSLRAAEKLLLSLPRNTPFSALLLAVTAAARHRTAESTAALLNVFILDPSAGRNDLAPDVFEELFIPHLLPVIQNFAERRLRILSTDHHEMTMDLDDERSIEATAAMSLLSRMSGGQAEELKELERLYEDMLDENTRIYAEYLMKIVMSNSGRETIGEPPRLVLMKINEDGEDLAKIEEEEEEEVGGRIGYGSRNGRYNPIWVEADQSVEFSSRHSKKDGNNNTDQPLYPQRVSPELMRMPQAVKDAKIRMVSDDSSKDLSSELDLEEENAGVSLLQQFKIKCQKEEQNSLESTCCSNHQMVDSDNILAYGKQTPPKDFVCPITSHLFDDPVTLETGQTYERKAIQEWLERGNTTCPITRQKLQNSQLPKTNYVLKRLIASWQEQSPRPSSTPLEAPQKNVPDSGPLRHLPSPTSVISKASSDGTTAALRFEISRLCTSEILSESEAAILQIQCLWKESHSEPEVLAALSKPAVVNGFVEVLFNSVNPQVLKSTVFMLSELVSKDAFVVQTLTRVESDVDCMVALFKKGLLEAVVLIYLLNPPLERFLDMDIINALLTAIKTKEDESSDLFLKPRTASILLLSQILTGGSKDVSEVLKDIISESILVSIISSLEADLVEEKIAAVRILLRCMEEDSNSRNVIAGKVELAPILGCFIAVGDAERFEIVCFIAELVKLSRRTLNEQLLHIIKVEGAHSMMHALLVYLQTALQHQVPVVAGLLLQLDILMEPRKTSIYREEAIDALITCLRDSDVPSCQLLAAEVIIALQGRFSLSGRPLTRAILLKHAGMKKSYRALMRAERMISGLGDSDDISVEEKAADEWERKMAYALASHEFGLLFEALAEGLKSWNPEVFSACLVAASWLTHMLSNLPETGIRGAARVCLLEKFVTILKSAKNVDDKALAMIALRSFMYDTEGMQEITLHIKDVLKSLRELKKISVLAYDILKLFSDGQESSTEMWSHKELAQVDCSGHGEVLSIICFRSRIVSGHSDGAIKVWSGNGNLLSLIQETREHTKAVTSLAVSQSSEKLYSGSLDKTVRVWSSRGGELQCIEVLDVKEQVNNLVVANTMACFVPHGAGVKVLSWNGGSKLLNPNKYITSLALLQGKLYCGCHDGGIQEIDLATGTTGTVQQGSKKLLAKANPIHAIQVHEGLLFSAGVGIDGAQVKIWNTSNYNVFGSLSPTSEVRSMTLTEDLIYLGCKMGIVEIWSKNKLTKLGVLQIGNNSKVQCLAFDGDGEVLFTGSSDGRLQAWGLV